jgi:signal transduction histidine kinase/DNA-binding response OmpR family regulator
MHKEVNASHSGRILVVDDTMANLQLLTNLLMAHGYIVYPASEGEQALLFVRSNLPDLILLDIRLPGIDGYEICRRLKANERTRHIPIIFITILENKHDKVKGFQAGAVDYITKPFQPEEVLARVRIQIQLRELTEHLEHKVAERTQELHAANAQLNRELAERRQAEAALRQSERLLNETQQMAKIGGWEWDVAQQTTFWTEETYRIHDFELNVPLSASPEHLDRCLKCYDPPDRPIILAAFQRCVQQGDGYDLEFPFTSANGCQKWIRTSAAAVREGGRIIKVVGTFMDITERKCSEDQLRLSEHHKTIQNRIAKVFLAVPDGEMYGEVLTVVLQAMKSRFGLFGFIRTNGDLVIPSMTKEIWHECQVPGKSIVFPQDTWGDRPWGKAIREQRTIYSAGPFHTPEGHIRIDHFLTVPIVFGDETIGLLTVANKEQGYTEEDRGLLESIAGYISPILNARLQRDRQEQARMRAEEEREKLQAQFLQAQKMESVGRLAGGIAHDFNNMLNVIIGHTELAMGQTDQALPLFSHLEEIRQAAERSADLTRQLLGFARRQTIAPKVLDLNEILENTLKMMRRLIGEDIELVRLPAPDLWPVSMDPSQIDQILANLCVNARDAIAGAGRVTIETENVVLNDVYCADHAETVPGEYVMLAVSDDGCGMDRETMANIFEPFFTTKELGKGTGLGLAMVYGVVRQNRGFINVYSEPGHGTTFRIYLPRHTDGTKQIPEESPAVLTASGHETILLVEDESAILDLAKVLLETFGYQVLAALTPGEAIRLANEYAGEIHLLITDVIMPKINGGELAKNIISLYPNIRCLFMSGYTSNIIAHHGVLDEGVNFIQKPFTMHTLAAKVRGVLDSK